MLDPLKNSLILILLIFSIVAGLYIKNELSNDDIQPSIVYLNKYIDRSSLAASASNLKLSFHKKKDGDLSLKASADSLSLDAQHSLENDLFIALSDPKPSWGLMLGYDYDLADYERYFSFGGLYHLGNYWYVMASGQFQVIEHHVSVGRVEASLIKLY